MKTSEMIGESLVRKGKLSTEQLQDALGLQKRLHKRLGEILVGLGLITEWDVAECLGEQYQCEMIDPSDIRPDPEALALVDSAFAISYHALPLRISETSFECIISDPIDVRATDCMRQLSGRPTTFFISATSALETAILRAYNVPLSSAPGSDKSEHRDKKRHREPDREHLLDLLKRPPTRERVPALDLFWRRKP